MKENVANIINVSKTFIEEKKYIRIMRFCITGGINTAVDFITFSIMIYFGVYYAFAQAVGYSLGTLNSYLLNKFWTFNDSKSGKKTSSEMIQFIAINVISFLATLLCLKLLKENLGVNIYLAKVFAIIVAQTINFMGYKLWVFKV